VTNIGQPGQSSSELSFTLNQSEKDPYKLFGFYYEIDSLGYILADR